MKTLPYKLPQGRLSAVALALLLVLPAQAATVNLNPVADAFVTTGPSGNLSGNNYGGAGGLSVAAPGLVNGEFQSVLQFDLANARAAFNTQFGAGQWAIQSISLSLTPVSPNNPIFNPSKAGQFGVSWMQNDSWTEGVGEPKAPTTSGITFSSLPSFTGAGDEALGSFSYNGSVGGSGAYILNLGPGLSADVAAGDLVSLRLFAADNVVSYLSNSRNYGVSGARPFLSVVAVPEPGTFSLLTVGAALLFCSRRQQEN